MVMCSQKEFSQARNRSSDEPQKTFGGELTIKKGASQFCGFLKELLFLHVDRQQNLRMPSQGSAIFSQYWAIFDYFDQQICRSGHADVHELLKISVTTCAFQGHLFKKLAVYNLFPVEVKSTCCYFFPPVLKIVPLNSSVKRRVGVLFRFLVFGFCFYFLQRGSTTSPFTCHFCHLQVIVRDELAMTRPIFEYASSVGPTYKQLRQKHTYPKWRNPSAEMPISSLSRHHNNDSVDVCG